MQNSVLMTTLSINDLKEVVIDCVSSCLKYQAKIPDISTAEKPDRYVNRTEARTILGGVSDPTLWAWEGAGYIKGYRLGNKIFYKYSELIQSGKFVDRTKK
jgi:hypothetical protein